MVQRAADADGDQCPSISGSVMCSQLAEADSRFPGFLRRLINPVSEGHPFALAHVDGSSADVRDGPETSQPGGY